MDAKTEVCLPGVPCDVDIRPPTELRSTKEAQALVPAVSLGNTAESESLPSSADAGRLPVLGRLAQATRDLFGARAQASKIEVFLKEGRQQLQTHLSERCSQLTTPAEDADKESVSRLGEIRAIVQAQEHLHRAELQSVLQAGKTGVSASSTGAAASEASSLKGKQAPESLQKPALHSALQDCDKTVQRAMQECESARQLQMQEQKDFFEQALKERKEAFERALQEVEATRQREMEDQRAFFKQTLQEYDTAVLRTLQECETARQLQMQEQKDFFEQALKERKEAFERALQEQKASAEQHLQGQEKAPAGSVPASHTPQDSSGSRLSQRLPADESAETSSSKWRSLDTFFLTPKEPPASTSSKQVTFHGRINPDATSCWFSFPGKYVPGWDALTNDFKTDSVACVFLTKEEEGFGRHAQDPRRPTQCLCHRIYGGEKPWGCEWYVKWFENVKEAVERKQRLKAVFFPGQVGLGKLTMDELSQPSVDLWDGIGIGGSQKCELATADDMGWEYDEVDVTLLLENQFPKGTPVHAWCEAQQSWRTGTVVTQKIQEKEKLSGAKEMIIDRLVVWVVQCDDSGELLETSRVSDTAMTVNQMLQDFGRKKFQAVLQECLRDIPVLEIDTSRLWNGLSALKIRIQIGGISSLHVLRDRVLSGELQGQINTALSKNRPLSNESDELWQVQVDKTRFFELYEDNLLALEEMTPHQREKLRDIRGMSSVHLSAPAGAGKTFVAVQRVLEVLMEDNGHRVLYVAPSRELVYHFLQWMVMRLLVQFPDPMNATIQQLLSHMVVMHKPYRSLRTPKIDDDSIEFEEAENIGTFALAVLDESHNIYRSDADRGILDDLKYVRTLLLSDESQSSAVEANFPSMERVRLQQVVRSTKRIVAGASPFQLGSEPVTSAGTDGPPLKTFLFDVSKATAEKGDWATQYAHYVVDALRHVAKAFPGVSLHKRVALLVPDDGFKSALEPVLWKALCERFPQRNFRLISFAQSLRSLPERLRGHGVQRLGQVEHMVLDKIDVAEGLEQLIVICIGLDAAIHRDVGDLLVRAQLYKGITRAQLMAIVVNKRVPNGWLEFLTNVRYSQGSLSAEEAAPQGSKAAAKICRDAVEKVKAKKDAALNSSQPQKGSQRKEDAIPTTSHKTTSVSTAGQEEIPEGPECHSSLAEAGEEFPVLDEFLPVMQAHESTLWDTDDNNVSTLLAKPLFDPLAAEDTGPAAADSEVPAGIRLNDFLDLVEEKRDWLELPSGGGMGRKNMYDLVPEVLIEKTTSAEIVLELSTDSAHRLGLSLDRSHETILYDGTLMFRDGARVDGIDVEHFCIEGILRENGSIRKNYWAAEDRQKRWMTTPEHGRMQQEDALAIPHKLRGLSLGEAPPRDKRLLKEPGTIVVLRKGVPYAELCGGFAPSCFISHYWGQEVLDLTRALQRHALHILRQDPGLVCYYFDPFCRNLHNTDVTSDWMQMPFNRALDHIADCFQVTKEKMFGAVMLLDNNCTAFERIWCIFEGWRCSELGVPLLVFSPQGRLSRISDSEQSREMAKKVSNIDAERAVCSEMRDKLMIDSAIETIPGRFTTVVAKFRLQVLDVAPFDEPQAVVRAPAPAAGGYYSGPAHGALRGSGHP